MHLDPAVCIHDALPTGTIRHGEGDEGMCSLSPGFASCSGERDQEHEQCGRSSEEPASPTGRPIVGGSSPTGR